MSDVAYPAEWKRYQLREIAEVRTGFAKGKKNFKDPLDLPYLRVANVQAGYLDLSEVKTVTVERADVDRYGLKYGDVLLTEGGDFDKLGRGTLWRGEIGCCLHQNHVFVVRTNRAVLLPEYLVWLTNSPIGRQYFVRASKQSTNLASINSTQLKRYPVVIPPVDEQEAIAQVIRTWEVGIAQTERLLRSKRRLRRGLVQQLLTGKRRFKEFEGEPWKEHQIGEVLEQVVRPVEWDDEELYDLVSIRRRSGGLFLRERRYGRQIRTKQLFKISAGDFLISKMQVVHGALGLVTPAFDGMKVSGSYVSLVASDERVLDTAFFGYLTNLPRMYHAVLLSSYGVHIEKMTFNLDLYLRTTVCIPPTTQEQRKIGEVLRNVDREIVLLRDEMELLKAQKRALMHKLLTGEVRVPIGITHAGGDET